MLLFRYYYYRIPDGADTAPIFLLNRLLFLIVNVPLLEQPAVILMGVELEHISATGPDPPGRYANKAKDELFEPKGGLEPGKFFRVLLDQIPIEVPDDGRQNHKGGVFGQKRTGQLFPAKIIPHHIKKPLAGAPLVIKSDNIFSGALGVIGQDGPPGVGPSDQQVWLSITAEDPADDQPVASGAAKRLVGADIGHVHFLGPGFICFQSCPGRALICSSMPADRLARI